MLRSLISLGTLLAIAFVIASSIACIGRVTGLLPAHPTPIIRVVHTNTGCSL